MRDSVGDTVRKVSAQLAIAINVQNVSFEYGNIQGLAHAPWARKNLPLSFCLYVCQLLADFQNSFTGTLCRQLAIICYRPISHHAVNVFLHYFVKYKCKQKLTIITKIQVND